MVKEEKVSIIINEGEAVAHFARDLEMDIIRLFLEPRTYKSAHSLLLKEYDVCPEEELRAFLSELISQKILVEA